MSDGHNTPAGAVSAAPAGGAPAPTGHAGADRLIARARLAGLNVDPGEGHGDVVCWSITNAFGECLWLYVGGGGRRLSITHYNGRTSRHHKTKVFAANWIGESK